MRLDQLTQEERGRFERMWTSERHIFVLVRSLCDPSKLDDPSSFLIGNTRDRTMSAFEDEELKAEIVAKMLEAKVQIVDNLPRREKRCQDDLS